MVNFDSYVICTSPRSGSTLLCNLLTSTGAAGNPASWFHKPAIADWLSAFNLTPDASLPERDVLEIIFNSAIAKGTRDSKLFGLRLQRHSFDFFIQQLAILCPGPANDSDLFHQAFGRTAFIYLKRHNKVEQAVSYVKAEQTGLWHMASDGSELERLSPPQTPAFNCDSIRRCIEKMNAWDAGWENWLETQSIQTLRVNYETLAIQPRETLKTVLGYLGINSNTATGVIPGVAKMADALSDDWVLRYERECINP